MRRVSLPLLLLTVAAVVFATGCPERTRIADLERNPSKYQNKDVAVAGTVRDSYGFSIPGTRLGGGAYKIDDGTGSIWVLVTEGSAPQNGDQVGVRGQLGTGVNWKGRNYGLGIYEKDRRYPKR
jgi:hypothetical protein